MKVLIAGGGIGGLVAALSCARCGFDVTLMEKAPAFTEIGAGIQISPNAVKVLRALGLEESLAQKSFEPEHIEARMGKSGRHIFTIPLKSYAKARWGAPYYHIHRADLIDVLIDALAVHPHISLLMDTTVLSYEQKQDGVAIHLSNGQNIEGDLLIGADGIHSNIRTQMLGAETPRFTGNVAWRAVIPVRKLGSLVPSPTACVWMGPGRHAVTYLLRGGELANFVGVVERDDWQKESWTETGSREEALSDFQDWHPTITTMIENAESLYRWALFDRAPLEQWTEGSVALLGDAAHPMLPFLAQGAAMAIEDGCAIAQEISRPGTSLDQAMRRYQSLRRPRTSQVQRASRKNAKTFHKSTLMGQLITYGPMWLGGKILPRVVHRRMDWIYGYDVTGSIDT